MRKLKDIKGKQSLSKKDVDLLNSKIGLRNLLAHEKLDLNEVLAKTQIETQLIDLQIELINLQSWVIKNKKKVVILFEGRDVTGKGGAIQHITSQLNPRHLRTIALNKPTKDEQGQWYFQRYANLLPRPGEIVFFDRSWYNRAMVEPVNEFCTKDQYSIFMKEVNEFEKMILRSKTHLIKFYFSITKEEQQRRFEFIKGDKMHRWKLTKVDKDAQKLWDKYTKYKEAMFAKTNTSEAPWKVINANQSLNAKLESIKYILKAIPYK